jgi:hypothetical protein
LSLLSHLLSSPLSRIRRLRSTSDAGITLPRHPLFSID